MKSLKQVLEASILDIDTNLDVTDDDVIKDAITKFINDNYRTKEFTISDEPNKDGKYEVSSKYKVVVINKNIVSLTNDLFVWDTIKDGFSCIDCISLKSLEGAPKKAYAFFCAGCKSLKSLEGAPEKVIGSFQCRECETLTTLKGAPEKVGGFFSCAACKSLQSLKYAPKIIGESFNCYGCPSLQSLEGAPEKVKWSFNCDNCTSLTSLKGAPKEVGGDFNCYGCKIKFKESDVKAVSNVIGKIIV